MTQEMVYPTIYPILLIVLYVIFFRRQRNGFILFVKYILVPLTILGGWIVYFIGYHHGIPKDEEFIRTVTAGMLAVFSTGRLFILGNDLTVFRDGFHSIKNDPIFMLWFSIIGASAVFISASLLAHLFGKRIFTWCKIWFDRSKENHLFFGVNETSLSLAEDLLKKSTSRLVIFIKNMDTTEKNSLYNRVEEIGALLVNSESIMKSFEKEKEEAIICVKKENDLHLRKTYFDLENLKKLRLINKVMTRPTHFFFLSEKESWNLDTSRRILHQTDTINFREPVIFHIRTVSDDLHELSYKTLTSPSSNVHINLLSVADITARQLVSRFNPVEWVAKDTSKAVAIADFNVLMIGFDQTGSAVLRKLIEFGQFVGSQFKATIIDNSLQSKKGRFAHRFPGLMTNYHINFFETETGSTEFFNLINQHLTTWDYIVIALGDDSLNIRTAIDIEHLFIKNTDKSVRILAHVENDHSFHYQPRPLPNTSIAVFGRCSDLFTESIVVHQSPDAPAKRIHAYYNAKKEYLHSLLTWDQLTRFKMESNISAAEHIRTKLVLAGLTISQVLQMENEEQFKAYLGQERLENLAMGEHLHWNAVYFTKGWETWPLKEIPNDEKSNKHEVRKLHACLVGWQEIAEVKNHFGEDYYQYDYESVINIFKLIKVGIYA